MNESEMIENPSLNRAERMRGQKFALLANILTPSGMYVMTGALMMIYAGDVLNLSASRISSILSIIPLVSLIRFAMLNTLSKIGKVRLMKYSSLIKSAVILSMILLPVDVLNYPLYLGLLISYSLVNQLGGGTAWQPLLREITTNDDRGRFFSKMRMLFTLVNLTVTGITPLIIGQSVSSLEYRIFLFIPLLSQLNMALMVSKVPEPDGRSEGASPLSVKQLWLSLKTIRKPLTMLCLVQFSFFPLFVLYLKQVLNLPSDIVTVSVFIGTLGNAFSLLFWGQFSDILGFRKTLTGVHILGFLQIPFFLLISPIPHGNLPLPALTGLILFSFLNGIVGAGSGIAMTSIQHFYSDREKSFIIFSLYSAATLLINSLWIRLNGFILSVAPGELEIEGVLSGFIYIDGVKLIMIAVPLLSKVILFFMARSIPDMQPHFGLNDFFAALNPATIRTIALSDRLYRLDDGKREEMTRLLASRTGAISLHKLTTLLKDPSYDVKVGAIRELGRSGSSLAGEKLHQMLRNPSLAIYHDHIVWSLGMLGWDKAKGDLIAILLTDRSEKLKSLCLRALGKMGDKSAVPGIKKLLFEVTPSRHLSSSACWALIELDLEESAHLILKALPLYKGISSRYEIMNSICLKLGIDNFWILKYGRDQGMLKALREYSESKSEKWRRDHRAVIEALATKDHCAIRSIHNQVFKSEGNHWLNKDLNRALEEQGEWNPLILLAAARLLVG